MPRLGVWSKLKDVIGLQGPWIAKRLHRVYTKMHSLLKLLRVSQAILTLFLRAQFSKTGVTNYIFPKKNSTLFSSVKKCSDSIALRLINHILSTQILTSSKIHFQPMNKLFFFDYGPLFMGHESANDNLRSINRAGWRKMLANTFFATQVEVIILNPHLMHPCPF